MDARDSGKIFLPHFYLSDSFSVAPLASFPSLTFTPPPLLYLYPYLSAFLSLSPRFALVTALSLPLSLADRQSVLRASLI